MTNTVVSLVDLEVPTLDKAQIDEFTRESVHVHELQHFDGAQAVERLQQMNGNLVLAADFGGDKGVTKLFSISNGTLIQVPDYEDYVQSDKGAGFLASLEKTAAFAKERSIPVGISWGGPIDGNKPLPHPKLEVFINDLQARYQGDFAQLLPTLAACANDSPAGLIAGAVAANKMSEVDDVLFIINGGGIGGAVLTNKTIFAAEPGHVKGVDALNKYKQTLACGVYGAEFVCVERFGSNKGGIEAQWQQITGEYMRARNIEDRYKEGNELARELYDNSALVLAHIIKGTAQAFDIDISSPKTAVVLHGSAFKFPGYADRIKQILFNNGDTPDLLLTSSFTSKDSNGCLDGAAYAALLA